jgi:hypothetical protein
MAHFINWRQNQGGQSLADVLNAYPGDFERARLNQSDMHEGRDELVVAERSKMFLTCIKRAEPK